MPKTTFFTAKMAVITVGDSQDTLDSACESNAWCQSNEINEINETTWDGIRMGWWCNDDAIWTYHESKKKKHNEVQPRVHVRLMRGSTHPPLGMRCWKCFCIMPSIVMRSPLLSLGFYEQFGIAIDDWCIYWCDACCKVAWVSQVPSHPPDVKVYSLALHKHLRAQNFIRCRESWFPHLRPGPSQFKPTRLSQGQRNNTSAVRHCETYHMISWCLHFPQLLTWKWNHKFKRFHGLHPSVESLDFRCRDTDIL